ncbi:cytochrome P450 [Sphingomonas sp. MMS24-JH45]
MDTVANALTFSFHFLAQHPEIQDRLRAEPESIPKYIEQIDAPLPSRTGYD